jgi:glyoxalase family protein
MATGTPGSAMTVFPWPGARPGVVGNGQAAVTAFSVPVGSLAFWDERLAKAGVVAVPQRRFGEDSLSLADPDGMLIELVEADGDPREPWTTPDVGRDSAIRGFFGATLWVDRQGPTGEVLTGPLGMELEDEEGEVRRYRSQGGAPGGRVDVVAQSGRSRGRLGPGVVHHVAWRMESVEVEERVAKAVAQAGLHPSPQYDRNYFQSVYFREPGGVLFELATDGPGFTIDEPAESLGSRLVLPEWLEPRRDEIVRVLPPLRLPEGAMAR